MCIRDSPYTAQMIATITRQQIGTVERALQIFLKLGLVEVLDSGTFYMSNIEPVSYTHLSCIYSLFLDYWHFICNHIFYKRI